MGQAKTCAALVRIALQLAAGTSAGGADWVGWVTVYRVVAVTKRVLDRVVGFFLPFEMLPALLPRSSFGLDAGLLASMMMSSLIRRVLLLTMGLDIGVAASVMTSLDRRFDTRSPAGARLDGAAATGLSAGLLSAAAAIAVTRTVARFADAAVLASSTAATWSMDVKMMPSIEAGDTRADFFPRGVVDCCACLLITTAISPSAATVASTMATTYPVDDDSSSRDLPVEGSTSAKSSGIHAVGARLHVY